VGVALAHYKSNKYQGAKKSTIVPGPVFGPVGYMLKHQIHQKKIAFAEALFSNL